MQLQLIRSATLILDYAGKRILIDPDFGTKHSRQSFTGQSSNPMVDLPIPPERILDGIELVIVSHLHADHFDSVAHEVVPKTLPLLCQPENEQFIRDKGFQEVTPVVETLDWKGIHITRTGGHHGVGEVGAMMKTVSGFVLQASDEPTLYWAGDTVLCDEVREAIATFQPGVVVTHSCGAMWPDSVGERHLIVMDAVQTIEVCKLVGNSMVIATHMEAFDHSTVSRAELRSQAERAGVQLRIPADGEIMSVPQS